MNEGLDTYAANRAIGHHDDERDYTVAAGMLKALGVTRLHLISNNPKKALALNDSGLDVVMRIPTGRFETQDNAQYLNTKAAQGGHQF